MNPNEPIQVSESTLASARVLFALLVREMATRFGGSWAGYLWALIEPLAFIALLSLAFSQIAHSPPIGRSFPLFYATGYIAFSYYNDIAALTGRSIHVNRPLLSYPVVGPLDTVLARFLLQGLTGLAVAAIVFAGILAVFADQVQIRPLPLMASLALAALLGLGVGLVNCTLFAFSKTWELIYGVIARPLFQVSAVFFTFASMPAYVREVLWWNPIIHLVGLMRAGFYPAYDASHVSHVYVLALTLGLIVAGLAMMRVGSGRLAES
ncbi:MAG: ABC transporter permease [Paracoccaceae bacterium]|nr:ABC transporter permease [Paracoccaceae bacterium]